MPGFNTLPAVGGGGGQANMTYVASIHMQTYNRSWAQGGTAGYYAVYSTNQENGYAYFVGATTTGVALNRLANITHSFTRIDVIAPQNDMVSLYKAKVKSTTEFPDAFAAFSSFPSLITSSGNFVLPNNALPLVNIVLAGGGGSGGGSYHTSPAAGGGGGGGVVKLTAYQAVGTTSISIGAGGHHGSGDNSHGNVGARTYFGNVFAGAGGQGQRRDGEGGHSTGALDTGVNGGGAGAHFARSGNVGFAQTSATGLGLSGSPVAHGAFNGGASTNNDTSNHNRGGGGAGAAENGQNGGYASGGEGGMGHVSDITGANANFGSGASSYSHNGGHGSNGWERAGGSYYAHGGTSGANGHGGSGSGGVVVVRYYIP
jgi:hypothetical protein